MRAVTEPFSPAALGDEPVSSPRVAEHHALDTCAIDRQAIDAALASAGDDAFAAGEAAREATHVAADTPLNAAAPAAAVSCSHPVWAQFLRLESLLCDWMTANPACDQLLLAEMRSRESPSLMVAATARPTTARPARRAQPASDYVAKLAAKLIRRSA